jgi:CheY-like chemotaxis protein
MVEDLLDMSRILSGKLVMELERTDLAAVIDAAIEAVRPAADAKNVRLHTAIGRTRPVNGDPGRLQQVLWNLLTNAIKFTPASGLVTVFAREAELNGQSCVEISVSDSGQGIDPKFLPFVFDRFRQADASTTRRHGGLGLGLSIVKSLVEMHQGTVEAQSPGEGLGATFIVCLPLAEVPGTATFPHAEAVNQDFESSQKDAPLTGLRILVVDDEADARILAQRVLEERGAEVVAVGSAAEAMRAVNDERELNVVVSDIGMPDRDGYDFIREMRALPGSAGCVPAIALTALARDEDRKRTLQAGYQVHISKPVDPAELVTVIATLAGRDGRELASA